jgi:hypothetical protein
VPERTASPWSLVEIALESIGQRQDGHDMAPAQIRGPSHELLLPRTDAPEVLVRADEKGTVRDGQ